MTTAQGWPVVGELQQALVEAGQSITPSEMASGIYGTSTRAAVEAFQQQRGLRVDGIAGPVTWAALTSHDPAESCTAPGWRCDLALARPAVASVLRAAVAEIGVHEDPDGSNRGPRVDVFTAPQLGIPWCAAFVSWAFRASSPPSPFGRILGAVAILDWGRAHGLLVEQAVEPGDVFVIARAKGRGHCGIVVADLGGGALATVEGNARNAVRGGIRQRGAVTGIVRAG